MSYDVSTDTSRFSENAGDYPRTDPQQPASQTAAEESRVVVCRSDRVMAAITYIGLLPLMIVASQPGSRFVRRHQRRALAIHLGRLVWVGTIIAIWRSVGGSGDNAGRAADTLIDLAALALASTPWQETFSTGALAWMLMPLAVTWILAVCGLFLAAMGRSADFHAFVNADWGETPVRRRWLHHSPEEERAQARRARQRQIERLERSSQLIRSERTRSDQISEINEQIERLNSQREYYDQLLALGEISQRRYETANHELDGQVSDLRGRLAGLTIRAALPNTGVPGRLRVNRLERPAETYVESLAIVTPSGVPIFTYGQFLLDEALVAGILSAFDSLSEEVFGSRVHKTWLDQGQVLYFAHGEHIVVMAIFDDEPAPRQVEQLRNMLQQFEQANDGPLSRQQHDPDYLHEVAIPFRFASTSPSQ